MPKKSDLQAPMGVRGEGGGPPSSYWLEFGELGWDTLQAILWFVGNFTAFKGRGFYKYV